MFTTHCSPPEQIAVAFVMLRPVEVEDVVQQKEHDEQQAGAAQVAQCRHCERAFTYGELVSQFTRYSYEYCTFVLLHYRTIDITRTFLLEYLLVRVYESVEGYKRRWSTQNGMA